MIATVKQKKRNLHGTRRPWWSLQSTVFQDLTTHIHNIHIYVYICIIKKYTFKSSICVYAYILNHIWMCFKPRFFSLQALPQTAARPTIQPVQKLPGLEKLKNGAQLWKTWHTSKLVETPKKKHRMFTTYQWTGAGFSNRPQYHTSKIYAGMGQKHMAFPGEQNQIAGNHRCWSQQ